MAGVAAALPGAAELNAHRFDGRDGHLDVDTLDGGTVGVAAFIVEVSADGVVEKQFVDEGVVDASVEAFHKQVGLQASNVKAYVGRGVERVGAFHGEVRGVGYFIELSVDGTDVEVLVVDLGCAESRGVASPEREVVVGSEAQVESRAEYRSVDHGVLVDACTGEDAPAVAFPFVLQVGADYGDMLAHSVGIVDGMVVQPVESVFQADGEFCGHEKERVEMAAIDSAVVESEVVGVAIGGAEGLGVVAFPVVALAVDMLERGEEGSVVHAASRQPVPLEANAVDVVLAAFGDMGHRRWQVEAVAAAAEVVYVVIFEVEFGKVGGAQVAAESDHAGLEESDFRVAVAVVVVGVAVPVVSEQGEPCATVAADDGGVEGVAPVD